MTVDELKAAALQLAPQARADLARELLSSLDELSEAEIEQLWFAEAARRDREPDAPTRFDTRRHGRRRLCVKRSVTMNVNGFSRYAVIDDRGDHVKDEIKNLLQQVGSLVHWSDRAPWMERVAR